MRGRRGKSHFQLLTYQQWPHSLSTSCNFSFSVETLASLDRSWACKQFPHSIQSSMNVHRVITAISKLVDFVFIVSETEAICCVISWFQRYRFEIFLPLPYQWWCLHCPLIFFDPFWLSAICLEWQKERKSENKWH